MEAHFHLPLEQQGPGPVQTDYINYQNWARRGSYGRCIDRRRHCERCVGTARCRRCRWSVGAVGCLCVRAWRHRCVGIRPLDDWRVRPDAGICVSVVWLAGMYDVGDGRADHNNPEPSHTEVRKCVLYVGRRRMSRCDVQGKYFGFDRGESQYKQEGGAQTS